MMLKSRPFFYSSPPKSAQQAENKKTAKASISSESESDSLSIESSSEEAHPKNHVRTENDKQIPPLEYFPQSSLELTGTDHDKKKKKKGLGKIIGYIFFDKGGKRKEEKPQKENCQPITVDEIKKMIQSQQFYKASEHLIKIQKSNSNLDSRNDEETLDNQTEIEDLLKCLYKKVFNTIESSISIASAESELLKNAVSTVVMWVEEEERSVDSQFRTWKDKWRNIIQKSVEDRMSAPPLVYSNDLSSTANTFLHMGKTMKDDMITVVQHIKHLYPEHFQVCNTYAKFYHNYFSSQMETFAEFELNKSDSYLLLKWTHNLYPNDIKNNSVLVKELDEASIGNLLPLRQIKHLEQTYLTHETDFIRCCLDNCLKIEVRSWARDVEPEILDDYYHSEFSFHAIKVIHESQKFATDITPELGHQMSALHLTELLTFLQCYRRDLETFITKYRQIQYFEAIIIANMNNFENFRIHTETITGSTDVKMNIFSMLDDLQRTGVNGLFEPLVPEMQTLLRKFNDRWDSCGGVMNEIITTMNARIHVFKRLKNPHRQVIMERIHLYLVQKYIQKIICRTPKLKTPENQNQLSERIRSDAYILNKFCTENGSNATWLESAIPSLAEIIRLQDLDAIKLEVSALASNYPDIKKKHLCAILNIKSLSNAKVKSILSVLKVHGDATLA